MTDASRPCHARDQEMSRRSLLNRAAWIGGLAMTTGAAGVGLGDAVRALAREDGWELPPEHPFDVIEHEWVEMPDGVRLSARLWLPTDAESTPVPVVFEYIPYRKRDLTRSGDNVWGETLAASGIAFARVDVRGSGESEGVITDEYSAVELDDAETIIEWLSKQPWSSGAVGMRGISWGGINTLQVASRSPEQLRAIMAISAQDNRFTSDAHYIGGTLGRTNFEWGNYFKMVMATPPDPEIVGEAQWEEMWRQRLDSTPPILATWTDHQRLDEYWQRGSVGLEPGDIQVPTYLVGGLHEPYSDEVGRMLERLEVPRKGLLGPWLHTTPYSATPNGLEWAYEEIRWWLHWLADNDETGIMDEPMLRAFVPYATRRQALPDAVPGRWVAEDRWPTGRLGERFYLNADGLGDTPVEGEPLEVPTDAVVGTSHREWYGQPADEQSADDALSLTFDTEPLADDTEILGYPTVRLRLTADQPVAQVAVRVSVVTENDESWLVDYGIRNLCHRTSFEHPEPLEPGEAYDVEFPLYISAFRFPAGSRIRVAISEGIWPMSWPSPQPVSLQLTPGVSSLFLPTRPKEDEATEMPIPEVLGTADQAPEFPTVEPDADGTIVIAQETPPYSYEAADVGTTLSGGSSVSSTITPGEPNSSVWEDSGLMGFQRGDWDCEVHSSYRLTSDGEQFHLTETLEARKGGEVIFERTHENSIPRRLI